MQFALRFLPQALIVIALAVVVAVVIKKLPKTAKLESDMKMQKELPGMPAVKKAPAKSKFGRAAQKTVRVTKRVGLAVGSVTKKVGKQIGGRVSKVYQTAMKKRRGTSDIRVKPVSVSEEGTTSVKNEKQGAVMQLLREAEDYTRQANWPAAEKVYIKVVALAPKTLEAYLGLGNLYLKQKNWDDAAEAYKVVLEGDRENIAALGNLGQALANKGEWVAAVDVLARAAKLDPGNAVRHATLGMAYMTIKDYKHATRAYKEAERHDRENLSHKAELAKAAHLSGDKALAEEMLSAVLARDPLNERAKTLLKEVREKKELE